jgi:hypothetical protein
MQRSSDAAGSTTLDENDKLAKDPSSSPPYALRKEETRWLAARGGPRWRYGEDFSSFVKDESQFFGF